MRIPLVCLVLFVLASSVQADQPFEAICERKDVLTFRYDVNPFGRDESEGWSTTDLIAGNNTWFFNFDGERLLINLEPAEIFKAGDGVIAAGQIDSGEVVGVWTYVIHTGFRRVVASNVYGDAFRDGGQIRTRAISLDCLFSPIEGETSEGDEP